MSSPDRAAKQRYIESQLRDSGHSQWLFAQYCVAQSLPDMDSCPLASLQGCMQRFKARYSPSALDLDEEDRGLTAAKSGEYRLKVQSLAETDLCGVKGLSVRMGQGEEVSGGFLLSPVMMFEVLTQPMGWSVRRKFSDFQWLHRMLSLQFPGTYVLPTQVPPLPIKAKDAQLPLFLTVFLEMALGTEIFRYSHFLRSFLASGIALFEGVVADSAKMKFPQGVEDLVSPSGYVTCLYKCEEDQFQVASCYSQRAQTLSRKLNQQFSSVCSVSQTLTRELLSLQSVLKELEETQDLLSETTTHQNLYKCMGNIMGQWADTQDNISSALNSYGELYSRYQEWQFEELEAYLHARECIENEVHRDEAVLGEKKEKLWMKGDPARWELSPANRLDASALIRDKSLAFPCMLYVETQKLQVLKDKCAYFQYQAGCELVRVLDLSGRVACSKASELGKLVDEEMQELCRVLRASQSQLTAGLST